MSRISFRSSSRGNLPQGNFIKAVQLAFRETMKAAKKDSAEGIKSRYVKPTIGTKALKMRTSGLSGVISSKGAAQSLIKFVVKPRKNPKKLPQGFFGQALRSGGGNIPQTFIGAGSLNGHLYQRTSKRRLPLKKVMTTNPPAMFRLSAEEHKVLKKVEKNFEGALRKYFAL